MEDTGVLFLEHQVTRPSEGRGVLYGAIGSTCETRRMFVVGYAHNGGWFCQTNHGQSCAGALNAPCKHVRTVLDRAITLWGNGDLQKLLQVEGEILRAESILSQKQIHTTAETLWYERFVESHGPPKTPEDQEFLATKVKTFGKATDKLDGISTATVFDRLARYLTMADGLWPIPHHVPIPEMVWFPSPKRQR